MLLSCLDSNYRTNFVTPFCMQQTLVIMNLHELHVMLTHKLLNFNKFYTLSFYLPTVMHYTAFLYSHINSYSSVFWCLLTASSGCCTPSAVPSQHIKCLCIFISCVNPLNAELNPICYLLALLGAHHFLHVSRIRVKSLTLRLLMSYIYIYIYGAPILDVSRSHTTTQHSR